MTNKETINRNIGLTFDFVKHLIDNPGLIEKLPDNFVLDFAEKDFSHKEPVKPIQKKYKSKTVRVRNSFELSL